MQTLDIIGAVLGLIYIFLEYKASIWLWVVSIIMPLVDMMLYFKAGLYADFGMAIYYALAAVYGFVVWKFGTRKRPTEGKQELPITHFPVGRIVPVVICFVAVWVGIYVILTQFTNSNVPVLDSFTTALSIVALWALAQKYAEQWLLWLVVDVVCCGLYVYKGIPFKASLYGLYVVIAVFGYRKWLQMMAENKIAPQQS